MRAAIRVWLAFVSVSAMLSASAEAEPEPDGIPTDEQKKATAAYVLSLQRDKGGFAEAKKENAPATLSATFAAVYALRYFGGDLKEKKTCGDFVLGCRKNDQRHYAPTPGGEPDVRATTLAALTLVELRRLRALEGEVPTLSAVVSSLSLADEAKTLEDYRLLGAGYERMSKQVRVNFNDKDQVIKKIKPEAFPAISRW